MHIKKLASGNMKCVKVFFHFGILVALWPFRNGCVHGFKTKLRNVDNNLIGE